MRATLSHLNVQGGFGNAWQFKYMACFGVHSGCTLFYDHCCPAAATAAKSAAADP